MSASEVKKYVVRLSTEQRELLESLIGDGEHRAAQVLRARVLLKADVSAGGKGWSDGRIVRVLRTSRSTVFRTRRRLIEEGFDAVLARGPARDVTSPHRFDAPIATQADNFTRFDPVRRSTEAGMNTDARRHDTGLAEPA